MKKISIVLSFLMMVSCGDKEEDKTETHTVTFKNISRSRVQINDNTGSATPLFGGISLQPDEFQSLTYKCEDCPQFAFYWELTGGSSTSCVCVEGDADYTIGHCPGNYGGDMPEVECKTCVNNTVGSTVDPCK